MIIQGLCYLANTALIAEDVKERTARRRPMSGTLCPYMWKNAAAAIVVNTSVDAGDSGPPTAP